MIKDLLNRLDVSRKLLFGAIFKRKAPLVIIWNVTYRCNLQCKYCNYWKRETKELVTTEALGLIEELASSGTRVIVFSGGEPILRDDLGELIDLCKKKEIRIIIASNGTLLRNRIKEVKCADEIKLSLDGPKEVNDSVRGKGVYDKVVEVIMLCKDEKVKVSLSTVISRHNILHIPDMLDVARKYNVGVYFHPADPNHSGDSGKTVVDVPVESEYKKAIAYLIKEKSSGNKFIFNSLFGLRHLYHWPIPRKIPCLIGILGCSIEPDGKIFICDNFYRYQEFLVSSEGGFRRGFDSLSLPYPCKECWCGSKVDFNLASSFNIGSMLELWKRYGGSL